jgi:hypothetical protein
MGTGGALRPEPQHLRTERRQHAVLGTQAGAVELVEIADARNSTPLAIARVGRREVVTAGVGIRGDIDDRAAPGAHHVWDGVLAHQHGAAGVDREHPIPEFDLDSGHQRVVERARGHRRSIVVEDVEPAEALDGEGDQGLHGRLVGDVHGMVRDRPRLPRERCRRFQLGARQVSEDDLCARLRERLCRDATDALRIACSGDDGDLALQERRHVSAGRHVPRLSDRGRRARRG